EKSVRAFEDHGSMPECGRRASTGQEKECASDYWTAGECSAENGLGLGDSIAIANQDDRPCEAGRCARLPTRIQLMPRDSQPHEKTEKLNGRAWNKGN
ncbi:3907_t:CDS:2, partial [Acaulospora colombiana]